ncbi:hypothetical protein [Paracoccus fontiphilus]|uniref:Methyltransferase domain-containing protein n=1 Tax=Paracoccus fontiphilus TaxID=1815556 RepID=A0ABV7ILF4_9RHOB|nr:hypothetical protein [Paracoccus fontiphilus]
MNAPARPKSNTSKALFRAQSGRSRASAPTLYDELPTQRKPDPERRAHDFYPTGQPEAIRGLLERDGDVIRACGSVWEPACGDGALVKEIRNAGIPCCASDLIERGCPDSWTADFFTCFRSRGRAIITNPPYSLINARDGHGRWLRHTLDMPGWDYLALLLSWDWPAAKANGLGELIDARPFSYCYLLRWKLDFTGEGSPPQRNAWFVWRRGWQGESALRFMDKPKGDARQEGLF